MKKTVTTMFAGVSTLALALSLAACGGNATDASTESADEAAATETVDAADATAIADEDLAADDLAVPEVTLTADDLAAPGVNVAFGDFDAMTTLANAIQNGEEDGTVVEIDGLVSNFAQGMSYNIVEENEDGSENVGTTFVIQGVEEDAYPTDGTHVKLTGKVGLDENGISYVIHTLPEFVETME